MLKYFKDDCFTHWNRIILFKNIIFVKLVIQIYLIGVYKSL